ALLEHTQGNLVLLEHARAVVDHAGLAEVALPLRRHVRVQVAPTHLRVLQLARPGHLDPLADALVGFVLRGHSRSPWEGAVLAWERRRRLESPRQGRSISTGGPPAGSRREKPPG